MDVDGCCVQMLDANGKDCSDPRPGAARMEAQSGDQRGYRRESPPALGASSACLTKSRKETKE